MREGGEMPPEKTPDEVEKARQEGYEKAKAEFEKANRKPLFEACRDYCKEHWQDSTDSLREGIAAIQKDYRKKLSKADVELCLAQQRRKRADAQKQQLKRQTGAITEYQVAQ